jgi:hypothetical protein
MSYYPSLAIYSVTNSPRIAYLAVLPDSTIELRYAHRQDAVHWEISTVAAWNVTRLVIPSLTLDSFGNPSISYVDPVTNDLMIARKTPSTPWKSYFIAIWGSLYSSLYTNNALQYYVIYPVNLGTDRYVVKFTTGVLNTSYINFKNLVPEDQGYYSTSMAQSNGNFHACYLNGSYELFYAKGLCLGKDWSNTLLDSETTPHGSCEIAIQKETPFIVYLDGYNKVTCAYTEIPNRYWVRYPPVWVFDHVDDDGIGPSICVLPNYKIAVSYYSDDFQTLKLATKEVGKTWDIRDIVTF